jgi:hypothetical protein
MHKFKRIVLILRMVLLKKYTFAKDGRTITVFGDVHGEGRGFDIAEAGTVLNAINNSDAAFLELGKFYLNNHPQEGLMLTNCLYYYIPITVRGYSNCLVNDIRCTQTKTPFASWKSRSHLTQLSTATDVKWEDLDVIISDYVANIGNGVSPDENGAMPLIDRTKKDLSEYLVEAWRVFKADNRLDPFIGDTLNEALTSNENLRFNPSNPMHKSLFQHVYDVGLLEDISPWYKSLGRTCVIFVGANHAEYLQRFFVSDRWICATEEYHQDIRLEEETSFCCLNTFHI